MKKILIVDDDPGIMKVLAIRLESNGYQVLSAIDGEKGIKEAQEQRPDLIIMDIMMPNLSGGDAVRILRSDNTTKDIPIIFLTAVVANMPPGAVNKGINVDGKFFTAIPKPFEPEHLLSEIKKLIGE